MFSLFEEPATLRLAVMGGGTQPERSAEVGKIISKIIILIFVNKSRQVLCDNAGMGAIDNFVYGDLCFIILRKNLQGLE